MKYLSRFLVVCSQLLSVSASASYNRVSRRDLLDSWADAPPARHLYPANVPAALRQRSADATLLKREATFDFVENHGTTSPDDSIFVTTLAVRSQQPILALEEIEEDLDRVSCSKSKIELFFASIERLEEFNRDLEAESDSSDFVVVTSHSDCNGEAERAPHIIKNVTVDRGRKCITLSRTDSSWKDAFGSMDVSFSRKPPNHVVRRGHRLIKRRDQGTSTGSIEAISSLTPTHKTMSFPLPPPSETPLPPSAKEMMKVSYADKEILPPGTPVDSLLNIPEGLSVSCKNCSMEGVIRLSQGSFSVEDSDGVLDGINATIAFFQRGQVQLEVQNFFAHIELDLGIDASLGMLNYSIPLPSIPITPFAIPGIVEFGIILTPEILMSLTLSQSMDFSYGFNLTVPNDSAFTIEMGELGNSSVTGFQDTEINALPFQSTQGITSLVFSVGFSPRILFGMRSPVSGVEGGVGLFFNLPNVSVNATQLDDVDENCNPITPSDDGDESDDIDDVLDNLVGNFTNIVPKVELNAGPFAEFAVNLGKFEATSATEYTVTSKVFDLPTACLAFDKLNGSYGSPAEVAASATGPPSAEETSKVEGKQEEEEGVASRVSAEGIHTSLWVSALVTFTILALGIGM